MKLPLNQVLCGDCREVMASWPEASIDLVVTSPPYWGLRDYDNDYQIWGGKPDCDHVWDAGSHTWKYSGGISPGYTGQFSDDRTHFEATTNYCSKCGAWKGSLGLEPHPQMFVNHIVEVSREIKRVIKPRGSYWLNLGDTYYGGGSGQLKSGIETKGKMIEGSFISASNAKERIPNNRKSNWLTPKQLLGIPWRVAAALQHDGWILRNCVIWYKPNHMPSSVQDRLTCSYEHLFFFVKSRYYHFNLDAIRVPHADSGLKRRKYGYKPSKTFESSSLIHDEGERPANPKGKNPGDSWQAHGPNTGSNNKEPYKQNNPHISRIIHGREAGHKKGKNPGDYWEIPTYPFPGAHFAVFPPALIEPIIKAGCPKNGVVLDPFAGSGTALRVARKLGRRFIGIDINPEYVEMSERRVRADSYSPPPEGVPTLTELLDRE